MGRIDSYPTGGAAPAGVLAYAEVTANQAPITTEVDITGLSVTVTVPAGRRIRISSALGLTSTVNDDVGFMRISEDATNLAFAQAKLNTNTENVFASVVLTPSSGAHTYKIRAARTSGTGNLTVGAAATNPAYILVEDITGTLSNQSLEWVSYTPTLTALTLGNGTVTARWVRIGRTIHYYFRFVLGSTSAVTGTAGFTLPTPPADPRDNADHYGTAVYGDFGTGQSHGIVIYTAGTVYFKMGGPINVSNISATTPFTWATNDAIVVRGTYEAAS